MMSSLLRSDPTAMRRMIGSSRSAVRPCTYCGVTAVSSTTTPAAFTLARPAAAPMSSTEAAAARASTATSSNRATSPPATRGPSGRSARPCCRTVGGLSGRTARGRARCRAAGLPGRSPSNAHAGQRPTGESGAEGPLVVEGEREVDGGEVRDGELPRQAGQPGVPTGLAVLGQPAGRDVVPHRGAQQLVHGGGGRPGLPLLRAVLTLDVGVADGQQPQPAALVVGPVAAEVVRVAGGERAAED